mgnify:CR=1 FL=1
MGTLSVVLPPFSPRGVRGCCHPASRRSSTPHEPPAAASLLRVCVCGVMRRAVAAHAQIPTHLPGRLGRQQLACVAGGAPQQSHRLGWWVGCIRQVCACACSWRGSSGKGGWGTHSGLCASAVGFGRVRAPSIIVGRSRGVLVARSRGARPAHPNPVAAAPTTAWQCMGRGCALVPEALAVGWARVPRVV